MVCLCLWLYTIVIVYYIDYKAPTQRKRMSIWIIDSGNVLAHLMNKTYRWSSMLVLKSHLN